MHILQLDVTKDNDLSEALKYAENCLGDKGKHMELVKLNSKYDRN